MGLLQLRHDSRWIQAHLIKRLINKIQDKKRCRIWAPFLIYLYYALENRPFAIRAIWQVTNVFRKLICRMPFFIRKRMTDLIAATVYWPLARLCWLLEKFGHSPEE